MVKYLMIFSLLLCLQSPLTANAQQSSIVVKRSIATVLFSTLGGAVLGLSTLSFYKNAQDHTDNITIGSLVGFAAGVGYLTYSNVDRSRPEAFMEIKKQDSKPNPVFLTYSYDF